MECTEKGVLMKVLMILILGFTLWMGSFEFQSWAMATKSESIVIESGNVLEEIQRMPDKNIPENLLRSCQGIAIFPSTISGAVVVGGKYGQGVILLRGENDQWSPPAIFTMVGINVGWQIGGEATDYVMLIMDRRGIDGLLKGKFKLGADVDISAGPVGRSAEASTDIQMKSGIVSYSRSRGIFAGVKVEGAVVSQDFEANKSLYGKAVTAREVLVEQKASMPSSAEGILKVLNAYSYRRTANPQ